MEIADQKEDSYRDPTEFQHKGVKKIAIPILEEDHGHDSEYEEQLKANGANYVMHMYPEANHGFHNDSTGRYDEAAAALSWERTIAFFREHLT